MSSNVPTVMGKVWWFSFIIQLIIIGLLFYLFKLLTVPEPFLFGALTYVILARVLRSLIAKEHRQGVKLVLQKRYDEAIPFFENSYKYFIKNEWADNYRFLTLLSSSKSSYTQMALDNLAFCYSQIGNGAKAVEFYKKALEVNPNDGLAEAGLNLLLSKETIR